MGKMDPILLLLIGLALVAMTVLWIFSIFMTARLARQGRRRRWPWVLLAVMLGFVPGGPVCLGIGYMAGSYRRCRIFWVLLQVAMAAAVVLGGVTFLPKMMGWSLIADLAMLLAAPALALLPVIVLAMLGPAESPQADQAAGGALVQAVKVHKTYRLGKRHLHVLRGVSLTVAPGEFVAILGASGSGKSTLLHALGLLDSIDSGRIVLDGMAGEELTGAQRDRIRCQTVGFIFQLYHLLPELNVLENTLLPVKTSVGPLGWLAVRGRARKRAMEILGELGLSDRLRHRPKELSGGEQQRVAIARALINSPKILLADEPTGNLDSHTGGQILKLLKRLNTETGQTIVMVTHDQALAAAANRIVHLRDGKIR